MNQESQSTNFLKDILLPSLVILLVIAAGIGTGWKLSTTLAVSKNNNTLTPINPQKGKEIGLKDEKTFRDEAEGTLEEGGIDGEGTHHLTRDGGPSQNVYMISSVVDLSEFVGHKVQVWGETIDSKKAGWLMDVGRIKITE